VPAVLLVVWTLATLALAADDRPLREAVLLGFTGLVTGILVVSEVLSLANAVRFWPLTAVWLMIALAIGISQRERVSAGFARVRDVVASAHLSTSDWAFVGVLAVFGIGTLLSGLLYPVVNYDSLSYHAPRVFFFYEYGSIHHYPTSFAPQLFSTALAEYFVLTLKTLAGGSDRLANMVQWLSYAISVLASSLLAMRLGAGKRGQQVAALAAAAIPMAVLEASTTQNDLTTAMWCLVAAYGVTTYLAEKPATRAALIGWVAFFGASLALAFQSKPPAYLVCFPLVVWLTVAGTRRDGWKRIAVLALSVFAVIAVLNSGWYGRNALALGHGDIIATTAPGNTHEIVRAKDPANLLTTALKNSSMLLATPSTAVNERISGAYRAVIGVYHGNLDNPLNNEVVSGPYRLDNRVTFHDTASAPVIMLLLLVAAVLVVTRGRRRARLAVGYLAAGGVALLMSAALISWNLFINRVLLEPVVVLVPLIGVGATLLGPVAGRWGRAAFTGLLGLALAWAATAMLMNTTNRLISPSWLPVHTSLRDLGWWNTSYDDLQFRVLTPELEAPSKAIRSAIVASGIERIGLDVRHPHFPVYPLLSVLKDRQVAYVRDTVLPDKIDATKFSPQVIIEVLPRDQYPAALSDGTPRGAQLAPPAVLADEVILFYRAK
jgi:hypothetical protein